MPPPTPAFVIPRNSVTEPALKKKIRACAIRRGSHRRGHRAADAGKRSLKSSGDRPRMSRRDATCRHCGRSRCTLGVRSPMTPSPASRHRPGYPLHFFLPAERDGSITACLAANRASSPLRRAGVSVEKRSRREGQSEAKTVSRADGRNQSLRDGQAVDHAQRRVATIDPRAVRIVDASKRRLRCKKVGAE